MKNQAKVLEGKSLANKLLVELKSRVEVVLKNLGGRKVYFAIIRVGENESSAVYVRNKMKAAEELGLSGKVFHLPEEVNQERLESEIGILNDDDDCVGVLLQLPVPAGLNWKRAVGLIRAEKDVDGLSLVNQGKLMLDLNDGFVPCTAAGIEYLLGDYGIEVAGKNIVIVGKSNIVGKPLALLLMNRGATVTVCHSRTVGLREHCLRAEVLVVATGQKGLIGADMVKNGAVVIDVGINRDVDGNLVGDAVFEDLLVKVSGITPVPGGVGPLTVAFLLRNVVLAHERVVQ